MGNFGFYQSPATTAVASHLIHSIYYSTFRPSDALSLLLKTGSAAPRDSSTSQTSMGARLAQRMSQTIAQLPR